jgi:hypothetical protein
LDALQLEVHTKTAGWAEILEVIKKIPKFELASLMQA